MAMHEVTSLALERLLPRAYRRSGVKVHGRDVHLVQQQPSHRSIGSAQAQHAALPRLRERPARVRDLHVKSEKVFTFTFTCNLRVNGKFTHAKHGEEFMWICKRRIIRRIVPPKARSHHRASCMQIVSGSFRDASLEQSSRRGTMPVRGCRNIRCPDHAMLGLVVRQGSGAPWRSAAQGRAGCCMGGHRGVACPAAFGRWGCKHVE